MAPPTTHTHHNARYVRSTRTQDLCDGAHGNCRKMVIDKNLCWVFCSCRCHAHKTKSRSWFGLKFRA